MKCSMKCAAQLTLPYIKGDPFTYKDFTPEQIAELQKPATDKLKEVDEALTLIKSEQEAVTNAEKERVEAEARRETAEAERVNNESIRIGNEASRVEAETLRMQQFNAYKSESQIATEAATEAANEANAAAEKATSAADATNDATIKAVAAANEAHTATAEASTAATAATNAAAAANTVASKIDERLNMLIVRCTQEEYDALPIKNETTLYCIPQKQE